MERDFYIELIYKSFAESLSPEEQRQLEDWMNLSSENRKAAATIRKTWEWSAQFSKNIEVDLDKDFEQLKQKMQASVHSKEAVVKSLPTHSNRSWWKPLSVAAAIIFLAGVFFIFNRTKENPINLVVETQSEKKEFTLADGSKVWLNKNSKLNYPEKMDGNIRRVVLVGEAFFDIQKDPNKPFIIEAGETQVEVLGTSFEVSAYPEADAVEVVVKSGKVGFGKKGAVRKLELIADQKGIFEKDKDRFGKRNSKDANATSWQNNILDFDDVSLEKVINDVENHFDIKLTIVDTALLKCRFTNIFTAPKQEETLNSICEVFKMKLIKVNDHSFRLEGGKCTTDTD